MTMYLSGMLATPQICMPCFGDANSFAMGCIERVKYEPHVLPLLGFQREHFQLGRFERGRHEAQFSTAVDH